MHEAHRAHVLSQHRWQHNQCSHPRTQNKAGFQSFRKVRSLTGVRAESSTAKADPKAARRKEKEQGRETYRPQSFKELLGDAVEAIEHALEDGVNRMEVDFPTLSGDSELHSTLRKRDMPLSLWLGICREWYIEETVVHGREPPLAATLHVGVAIPDRLDPTFSGVHRPVHLSSITHISQISCMQISSTWQRRL